MESGQPSGQEGYMHERCTLARAILSLTFISSTSNCLAIVRYYSHSPCIPTRVSILGAPTDTPPPSNIDAELTRAAKVGIVPE